MLWGEHAGCGGALAWLRRAYDFALWVQELFPPYSQMFYIHIGKGMSPLESFRPIVLKMGGNGKGLI